MNQVTCGSFPAGREANRKVGYVGQFAIVLRVLYTVLVGDLAEVLHGNIRN